ncbi:hypothetical protein SteCoe_11082 [Stentor coeruleus]|uniref:Tetratricopeptide repeat protein n=1 Tax=Stentor coeruleus TaxID=5963 RepID=A0A1R2CE08_9CILI|nr:hypothetical protein SteCoe_11082 [Stentor coeruleus]
MLEQKLSDKIVIENPKASFHKASQSIKLPQVSHKCASATPYMDKKKQNKSIEPIETGSLTGFYNENSFMLKTPFAQLQKAVVFSENSLSPFRKVHKKLENTIVRSEIPKINIGYKKNMKQNRQSPKQNKTFSPYFLVRDQQLKKKHRRLSSISPRQIENSVDKAWGFVREKQYELALKILKKIKTSQSFYLMHLCYKHLSIFQNALKSLNRYNSLEKNQAQYFLELGRLYYHFKNYPESMHYLQSLAKADSEHYHALYYLAKCYLQTKNQEEAELLLEKVANNDSDSYLSSRAIHKLSWLQVECHNFYGAYHTLQRKKQAFSSFQKTTQKTFTEAMYYIVQQSFEEAIELLSSLIVQNIQINLIQKCYIYRAFAYFSSKSYDKAIEDYEKAQTNSELDKYSKFNYEYSQAIKAYETKNYDQALECLGFRNFYKFPNPMWQILRVYCHIFRSYKQKNFFQALAELKLINSEYRDKEILYLKALLCYYNKKVPKALKILGEYFDAFELRNYSVYVLKGFCEVMMRNYLEAFEDFTEALKINRALENLYPYRGVCALFCGMADEAEEDFLRVLKLKDPNALLLSAYLLVFAERTEKALDILEEVEDTVEVVLIRAHCYLLNQDYDKSIEVLNSLSGVEITNDISTINHLKQGIFSEPSPGLLFNEKYTFWIEGIRCLYNHSYTTAADYFETVLSIILNSQDDLFFKDNFILQEENCEILYNIALCSLLNSNQERFSYALEILIEVSKIVGPEHLAQITILCVIIYKKIGNENDKIKMLEKVKELAPELYMKFVDEERIELLPLKIGRPIHKILDLVCIPGYENIWVKPAFRLPRLQPPLEVNETYDILLNLLDIEKPALRPEVPWIGRAKEKGIIMFTDKIVDDVEIEDGLNGEVKKKWHSFKPCCDKIEID